MVAVENFRHNIVVDGPDLEPYDEDTWDWIKVGDDVVLRNVKDCTRCILTTIGPENGIRDPEREPLRTLEKYLTALPVNTLLTGLLQVSQAQRTRGQSQTGRQSGRQEDRIHQRRGPDLHRQERKRIKTILAHNKLVLYIM